MALYLDIKKLNPVSKKYSRRIRVVNHYNNKIGNECVWQRSSSTIWQTIQDVFWRLFIQGQILILEDINTHSSIWNFYCQQNINIGLLKKLIKRYKLIINNNTKFFTYLLCLKISIMYLTLISLDFSTFQV